MAEEYIIASDVGTQSTRIMIFDKNGNVVSRGVRKHKPHVIRKPGWAEHPEGDLWNAFKGACREAMDGFKGDVSEIKAFGLSTQRCVRVYLDKDGNVMQPIMSWLDNRTLHYFDPNPPYDKTYKLLTNSGYYTYLMTGELKDTCANLNGITYPVDRVKRCWIEDDKEFAKYNLRRDQLSELVDPGTVMGYVNSWAAEELHLPEGLPVVAAAGDKEAEALGGGAVEDGQLYITCGTYCGPALIGSEYVEGPSIGCNIAANPGKFTYECYGVRRGFWMVSWFARNFGPIVKDMMDREGIICEEALNRLAEQVPPGCEGLMLIPDFVPPSASMPYRRGSYLGFDGRTTAAHMYRAILEGMAMTIKMNLDWMKEDIKKDVKEIRIGGGGSNCELGMQIFSDVLNVPVVRTTNPDCCTLGAAICGAVGSGIYKNFDEAVKGMVHVRDSFTPDPDRNEFYEALIKNVYSKVRPITDEIYKAEYDFWEEWDEKAKKLAKK